MVATSNVDKHLSSDSLSRSVYRSSFEKCSALWNKVSRSTVASDHVQDMLKRKLLVPSPTRWISYYNAVLRVVGIPHAKLNELCISVELRCFTERELTFLKEYCIVLKPLSRGLDILQGEYHCSTAYIANKYQKDESYKTGLSCMTTSLVAAVESNIRFSHVFESRDAIIVAVTSPNLN